IDLSPTPLAAGGTTYLLFVDDNADGVTDHSYTIDNFLASPSGQPPTFARNPANTNVVQCQTASFSVQVSGSPPINLQWYHNNAAITGNPTATSSTLVINNAQSSDAGPYFCQAQNNFGTKNSTTNTLTVTPDNTPPTLVHAVGLNDMVTIVITFSEAMKPDTA